MPDRRARIRNLNDKFRTTLDGGRVVVDERVNKLGPALVAKVLTAVRDFDQWDQGNDPLETHDFGMFDVDEHQLVFMITYLDMRTDARSTDLSNPNITTRVLTISMYEEV